MKNKIQILFFVIVTSCQRTDIKNILNDKKSIVEKTENSTMVQRSSMLIYKTKNDFGNINEYFFELKDSVVNLHRTSISYPSEFYDLKNEKLNQALLDSIVSDLYIYLNKYHLDGYSSDFSDNGIKLKFYLKNGGALLYIPDMKRIKESNYKLYIKKSEFLEKNWYYTNE